MLSDPKRLRYFMQRDEAVLGIVLRIFLRITEQSLSANCPGTDNWASWNRALVVDRLPLQCCLRVARGQCQQCRSDAAN